ncbi:substrate-binding periplasmic protein [Thalassotalea profundi]|uniref:substrate-binding periplasmic protein n=1 Tax=Thalassotalea profundi TaxID=2036687 RepID=UPI00167789B4|nr:transporter substrate-binding domain-containing protein [Thalassotalea profundi]
MKWLLLGSIFSLSGMANAQEITAYTELLTPYQILDEDNKLTGFSTAVVKTLANKVNDTVNFELLPWERAYRGVKENKNTLIFSLYRSKQREKHFKWVGKLDENIHNFYALRSNVATHIKSEKATKRLITAVISNSYEDKTLTARGYTNLMRVSNEKQVVNMLFSHRIDLLFGSEVTIANLVTEAGRSIDDIIKLVPISNWGDGLYIAFNKDSDADLVKKYQRAYQELLNDGVITKLKKQHFKFNYIAP